MKRLLQLARFGLAFLFLLVASPAAAAAAVGASGTAAVCTAFNATSGTVTRTEAAGNTVVVVVAIRTTTSTVSSITDTGGSTYTFRKAVNNGTVARVEMWSTNAGASTSSTSVTINLGATSKFVGCVFEYTGVLGLGNCNTNTGSSTTPTIVNTIAQVSGFIVAGFAAQGTATFSANVGTLRASAVTAGGAAGTNAGGALNDNTSAAQSYTAVTNTVTLSVTNAWAAVSMDLQGTAPAGDLVQAAVALPAAATTAVNTFAIPNVAGRLIVISLSWNGQTTTASITDSNGNTYASAVGPINYNGTSGRAQIFFAKNIVGGGSNAVTVSFSAAPTSPSVSAFEFANQDTAAPLDVTASAIGTGTAANSGTATTNFAHELIVGFCNNSVANMTPGAGFTSPEGSGQTEVEDEYKAVTVAGSNNTTATLIASGNWVMLMATFKNAVQPGGAAPKRLTLLGVG